jgi:hypothetical protein
MSCERWRWLLAEKVKLKQTNGENFTEATRLFQLFHFARTFYTSRFTDQEQVWGHQCGGDSRGRRPGTCQRRRSQAQQFPPS